MSHQLNKRTTHKSGVGRSKRLGLLIQLEASKRWRWSTQLGLSRKTSGLSTQECLMIDPEETRDKAEQLARLRSCGTCT